MGDVGVGGEYIAYCIVSNSLLALVYHDVHLVS